MSSTDIDGSPIAILSKDDGTAIVYALAYLEYKKVLADKERKIGLKICKQLNLPYEMQRLIGG